MRDGWVMIKPPRGRPKVQWCEKNIVDENTIATLLRQGCLIIEVEVIPLPKKEDDCGFVKG